MDVLGGFRFGIYKVVCVDFLRVSGAIIYTRRLLSFLDHVCMYIYFIDRLGFPKAFWLVVVAAAAAAALRIRLMREYLALPSYPFL
ncbi:hypothetical protein QBC44DRAFT_66425 [Cladorrhinum sp. PSN332]|nr:hypothetical protein QBC44DRAFT_66425 [Cladorrhinum sp. PSN332]